METCAAHIADPITQQVARWRRVPLTLRRLGFKNPTSLNPRSSCSIIQMCGGLVGGAALALAVDMVATAPSRQQRRSIVSGGGVQRARSGGGSVIAVPTNGFQNINKLLQN